MAEALEEIVVAKRQRYEDWRHKHMSTPFLTRIQRQLIRFALASVLPAAAIAFGVHHNFDRQKMQDAIRDGGSRLRDKVGLFGGSSSKKSSSSSNDAASPIEAAPVPHASTPPAAAAAAAPSAGAAAHSSQAAGGSAASKSGSSSSSGGAAAALREAEAALKAAEAAQRAALDELQRTSSKPQKKGWF